MNMAQVMISAISKMKLIFLSHKIRLFFLRKLFLSTIFKGEVRRTELVSFKGYDAFDAMILDALKNRCDTKRLRFIQRYPPLICIDFEGFNFFNPFYDLVMLNSEMISKDEITMVNNILYMSFRKRLYGKGIPLTKYNSNRVKRIFYRYLACDSDFF